MTYEIEITRKGVYKQNAKTKKDEMVPVGTRMKVKELPRGWVNKYRIIKGGEDTAQSMETGQGGGSGDGSGDGQGGAGGEGDDGQPNTGQTGSGQQKAAATGKQQE